MRTIKFRFWDNTEKRMKFLNSIWNMPDPSYDFDEIQQFTGLLDKNGKEIYEGDIIEYESYWYTYGDSGLEKVKKEVTWQNIYGAGWHFGIGHKDGEKKWSFPFPDCEVIGNIYENPDLLSN